MAEPHSVVLELIENAILSTTGGWLAREFARTMASAVADALRERLCESMVAPSDITEIEDGAKAILAVCNRISGGN